MAGELRLTGITRGPVTLLLMRRRHRAGPNQLGARGVWVMHLRHECLDREEAEAQREHTGRQAADEGGAAEHHQNHKRSAQAAVVGSSVGTAFGFGSQRMLRPQETPLAIGRPLG